ncbi:MAG TPA: sulfotransferase [Tepidisphaeraceae bacterium]|jgi:hypothetical protein|nr:sulfotransferase [Tepidisphaeraceae bacterium]
MLHFSWLSSVWAATRSHAYAAIAAPWSPLKKLRRSVLMPLFALPDTGIFGLKPLRLHILICGFPRAGTTLLQMMLENAHPEARRFGREVGGWRAATYSIRNHAIVISKVPHDIARLEGLRHYYEGRKARLKIIVMIRDPRDVMTSQRTLDGVFQYCVPPDRWRFHYQHILAQQGKPDVLLVRYEDLVRDVDAQQARIEAFTGEPVTHPFGMFHEIERKDFDTSTLNGLRPVEQSLLNRWRAPKHKARIEDLLRQMPELPQALIDLGYETDDSWVKSLTAASADA